MLTRPLVKDVLKKMFLRVLWEHKRPGGKYTSGHSWGIDAILGDTLPFHFQLKNPDKNLKKEWALTKEERNDALLAVEELQRSDFIRDDPDQDGRNFKILTEKGIKCAEKEPSDMNLPSVYIEE